MQFLSNHLRLSEDSIFSDYKMISYGDTFICYNRGNFLNIFNYNIIMCTNYILQLKKNVLLFIATHAISMNSHLVIIIL